MPKYGAVLHTMQALHQPPVIGYSYDFIRASSCFRPAALGLRLLGRARLLLRELARITSPAMPKYGAVLHTMLALHQPPVTGYSYDFIRASSCFRPAAMPAL